MAYTDLWRCRHCSTMPEIVMLGKNFIIRCNTCNSEKVNVYGHKIDDVVSEWNRRNDPARRTIRERLGALYRCVFHRE